MAGFAKANALNADETNFTSLFEQIFLESDVGTIIIDRHLSVVTWNTWVTQHSGTRLDSALGKNLIDLFPVLQGGRLQQSIVSAISSGMTSILSHSLNKKPFPLKNKDGHTVHQSIIIKPLELLASGHYCLVQKQDTVIPIELNNSRYCLIQINDVTSAVNREKQLLDQALQTKKLAASLVQEKERAQVTLDSIADAVITTDQFGIIVTMNPVAEILMGIFEEEGKGKNVCDVFKLIDEQNHQPVDCTVTQCLEQLDIISNDLDHILVGTEGRQYSVTDSVAPIFDADRELLGAVLVFRDVTQTRSLTQELNWQALHDPLTGLENRRAFESKMQLLQKSAQSDYQHHLLYLDLDQFKVVNDTCGHDAGDELLKQITVVLQNQIRKNDLLARLGGDEFGVLLEGCNEENSFVVANKLRSAVQDFRFGWQNQTFKIGVSIGIAKITGSEAKAADVLSAADSACYVAKEQGRNRVHFHEIDASESSNNQNEMRWISRIQEALDKDRFVLYAQRIQDAQQQSASPHYEVLVRMLGSEGEIIPPGAFLPAAERFNLIASLDRWVFDKLCDYLEELSDKKIPFGEMVFSMNLSGTSLVDKTLLHHISKRLDEVKFPSCKISFEVTETAAIANLSEATHFLSTLREKGCKIALDDFGSGLSSFAYLKTLPIDYLKIDGQFVKDITHDPIYKAFVESINQIGHVMGLSTIAEFVEDDEIFAVLKEIGVDYAQGYGIHKPCPIDDVLDLLCQ
jgi:diguanylate cyclase (GGDEF)-like protein/PAS domain S-box-containing protein